MLKEQRYMKIGEIASVFNVSVKALRVYEKKGLITPAAIDHLTGYRLYDDEQVAQLSSLLEMKSLGFSLAEIKDILKNESSSEFLKGRLLQKRISWQDAVYSSNEKANAADRIYKRIDQADIEDEFTGMTEEQRVWLLIKLVCNDNFKSDNVLSEALWL